ncbi:MAG: hypothetical protein WBA93_09310 [Microcoleaceae cyanobacterium]
MMRVSNPIKTFWNNIKNIPDRLKKLIELSEADGAIFLDSNGNYRVVAFGDGVGEMAEGNHDHSQLSQIILSNASPATSSTTGALRVPGIGMGDGNIYSDGILDFGVVPRQMLNLFGNGYGIGVQNVTTYFRSNRNFAFFVGGTHAGVSFNPGFRGSVAFQWDGTNNTFEVFGDIACNGITVSNGSNGTFTTSDSKSVTVVNGIVVQID